MQCDRRACRVLVALLMLSGLSISVRAVLAAEDISIADILAWKPAQRDVVYEIPDPKTVPQCKVTVVQEGKASGWVVTGPQGQIFRRFMDTDGDGVVDQWSYYHQGIEAYRDIDSTPDKKTNVDQSRWLNFGGTRWGVDQNSDGRIDYWKVLSAEEASSEAIRALVQQDLAILKPILVTADDLAKLEVDPALQKKILESVADPAVKLRKGLTNSKVINAKTTWLRFDASTPSIIPADAGRASKDLVVYENAMAIVQNGQNTALVQIGELVRVGEVWKLTSIPQPIENEKGIVVASGLLIQPDVSGSTATPVATGVSVSPELQKFYEQLQELDKRLPGPTATRKDHERFNIDRADLIERIRRVVKTADDYATWTKQLADHIAITVQMGTFPDGVERLIALETEVKKSGGPQTELLAYVTYRRINSQFGTQMQTADAMKRQQIQTDWMKELEEFVKTYPKADESAEAAFQIAMNHEFAGNIDDAKKWYKLVAKDWPKTEKGVSASGALKRLDLNGNPINLVGPGLDGKQISLSQFKGRVVVVQFWATWCKTCTEDLPQLKALHQEFRTKGFEIVGVNLDDAPNLQPIQKYLADHGVQWTQIVQPQGQRGPIATGLGLISLPTMFLIDQNGIVVNRGVAAADLKTAVPELLGIKKKDTVKPASGTK